MKKTFWHGAYAAGHAKLAAGDVDSDGDCDAICLYRKPDGSGRLDVFLSSKKAFAGPTAWYDGAAGPLPATNCRFAAGDVTGDGRADVVIAQATGDTTSSVTTCVSGASAFAPQVWWQGDVGLPDRAPRGRRHRRAWSSPTRPRSSTAARWAHCAPSIRTAP